MINNTHREKVEFNTSIYQIAILQVQTFPEFNIFHFFFILIAFKSIYKYSGYLPTKNKSPFSADFSSDFTTFQY